MNDKYGIGFFSILIILLIAVSYGNHAEYERVRKISESKYQNQMDEAVLSDGTAVKGESFYLLEQNECVIVMKEDKKTVYEYTDILLESLPVDLQKEIEEGKYVKNEEELFGFLENYSS